MVIYDSGQVSLEHLLFSWYPYENPSSQPTLSLSTRMRQKLAESGAEAMFTKAEARLHARGEKLAGVP